VPFAGSDSGRTSTPKKASLPAMALLRTAALRCCRTARGVARLSSVTDKIDEAKFLLGDRSVGSLHDYEATTANGVVTPMSNYAGKAVLVVNVASL
jgi:hypothetical protein